MRREKRNNIVLFVYLFLAVLLCGLIVFYIYANTVPEAQIVIEHPQVGQYSIVGEVTAVLAEERLLSIIYEGEEILVGLLPESELIDRQQSAITLSDIMPGDQVAVEVEFIGTGAVLASQVVWIK